MTGSSGSFLRQSYATESLARRTCSVAVLFQQQTGRPFPFWRRLLQVRQRALRRDWGRLGAGTGQVIRPVVTRSTLVSMALSRR
jgi:hypothetical protein